MNSLWKKQGGWRLNLIGSNFSLGITILLGIVILALGVFFGLLYLGIDRKLVARMQGRIGPPIRQPFRDVSKLLMKESIIPDDAISWLFKFAPVLCLMGAAVLLLYVPLFGQPALLEGSGDIIVVLYLLIIPALALVLAGFSSSSPFATVGAQREMVTLMSYEFPLVMSVVAIAWHTGHVTGASPFLFSTLAAFPIWGQVGPVGIIGAVLLLLVLLFIIPGELSKIPFDMAEAETELAGGVLVEYSGRNFALFYVANAVKAIALVAIVVGVFFPYNLSPVIGIGAAIPATIVDGIFFLVKVFLVMFVSVMVARAAMARFKIDQASKIYFISSTLVGLLGLILLWIDLVI